MKKNYIFKFILLLIPIAALTLMSNAGGRSAGASSSPGDNNQSCAACHNGGSFNAVAEITTNIPVTGYELDTDYTITLNTSSNAVTHGFQMAAENNSNAKIGAFSAGSGTRIIGNTNISHSSPLNSGDWTITWRSPSTDEGKVTFYAAVNAANGNGSAFDGSDVTVTASSSAPSLSISAAQRLDFSMYPNPASEFLTFQLPNFSAKATIEFYDYVGRLALSKTIFTATEKVNVSNLSKGVYILKVISDDKIGSQKFIKQ